MPVAPTRSPSADDDGGAERSLRLLWILGALGVLSAVIAGVVIFSSGETRPPKDPVAPLMASGESLVVGRSSARTEVVVYEDFASRPSRDFEIASRDFLLVEAAQGDVRVEYHPFQLAGGSPQALEAWAAVAEHGTAKQAMAFRNLIFDRQPDAGAAPDADALEAWAVKVGVHRGLVRAALDQPDPAFVAAAGAAARAAGARVVPTVLVDGKPLEAANGTQLADQLQRQILG